MMDVEWDGWISGRGAIPPPPRVIPPVYTPNIYPEYIPLVYPRVIPKIYLWVSWSVESIAQITVSPHHPSSMFPGWEVKIFQTVFWDSFWDTYFGIHLSRWPVVNVSRLSTESVPDTFSFSSLIGPSLHLFKNLFLFLAALAALCLPLSVRPDSQLWHNLFLPTIVT